MSGKQKGERDRTGRPATIKMAYEKLEDVTDRHLHLFWMNADPITSEHMVMMYATNGLLHGWWDRITVILWGSTQPLALENEAVQLKMEVAKEAGVEFSACIACAINLGTKAGLEEMGVEVIPWGQRLAELQQNGKHVLTI